VRVKRWTAAPSRRLARSARKMSSRRFKKDFQTRSPCLTRTWSFSMSPPTGGDAGERLAELAEFITGPKVINLRTFRGITIDVIHMWCKPRI
jgi:hypothetical protein